MIKDLQIGTVFKNETFAVTNLKDKTTSNQKPYKAFTLSDSSANLQAKIWSDNFAACEIGEGKIIEASGRVGEWPQGTAEITLTKSKIITDLDPQTDLYQPQTLIFDIETVGQNFDRLGEWEQDYLLNHLEKNTEDKEEAQTKTGLWSMFAFISTIGCFQLPEGKGQVYHLCDTKLPSATGNEFTLHQFKTEAKLLRDFWQFAEKFENFVTFNGRGFDFPFLYLRSLVNHIKVPSKLIQIDKSIHYDLFELLKQGNRGFKLEALTRFLGLTNPKQKDVSGLHVSHLYEEGKHQEIVDYVSRDVIATKELFLLWQKYLS